ncbi:transporter substrate-binding domain-containing protein [Colwellia sp. D2M02]|uniref:Solute-binding protein family 3/N-terminal domain-containing protein n=1 Tax=Colwellia asteriadis TaxID=517723 RepID=A0ABN1LA34_9GAMM|nr:transporter substrate-binding domain-containing protein [Colwellia sp. D2M02]MBU2893770.1 transporter substrate-binding domain-containing protein [Colwellia sp. D2M02]
MSAGLSKPPFVIANDNENSGIQLDVIRAAFATEQQGVNFIHVPLARSFSSINKWHFDGTITLPTTHQREDVYLSDPYIGYQNVVITLAEDNIEINDVSDLANKRIVAFQMAKNFLGPDYVSAVNKAQDYRELADQMKQIDMLFFKRTDALVLDISIFKYFLLQHHGDKYKKSYIVHQIFKPVKYGAGFKNKADRDKFNQGLKVIKANGTYQKILDKYQR